MTLAKAPRKTSIKRGSWSSLSLLKPLTSPNSIARVRRPTSPPSAGQAEGGSNPLPTGIPCGDLLGRRRQMVRGQQCQAHRQLAAIAEQVIVADIAVVGGVTQRCLPLATGAEALDPRVAGGAHRDANKFLLIKRQHDMQA